MRTESRMFPLFILSRGITEGEWALQGGSGQRDTVPNDFCCPARLNHRNFFLREGPWLGTSSLTSDRLRRDRNQTEVSVL